MSEFGSLKEIHQILSHFLFFYANLTIPRTFSLIPFGPILEIHWYQVMMMIGWTTGATASYPKYHKNRILLPNAFCSKFYIKATQSQ